MSHDGCHEVTWKGKAFPYLMHHHGFHATENYGSARQAEHSSGHGASHGHGSHAPLPSQQGGSDVHSRAGTGTWNGPAPRGMQGAARAQPATAASAPEPDSVRLSNGSRLPLVGLDTAGMTNADDVKSALEQGYRHLDVAECSGPDCEAAVGAGLAAWLAGAGAAEQQAARRAEVTVSYKLWNTSHRPEAVRRAVEGALSRLGCGALDLLLLHWPEAWAPGSTEANPTADAEVTLGATWGAMEALVDEGKVRALGVGNFSLKQVEDLLATCRVRPLVNQVELHPLCAQRKLVGVCFRHGVQCVAHSALGDQELLSNARVGKAAQETGKTAAQVSAKWNTQRGVPVVLRPASADQRAELSPPALAAFRLGLDAKAALDEVDAGRRVCAPAWKQWANAEEGGVVKPSLVMGL